MIVEPQTGVPLQHGDQIVWVDLEESKRTSFREAPVRLFLKEGDNVLWQIQPALNC